MTTRKLVKLKRGSVEIVAVTTEPLTWHDRAKVYYLKAFAILSELLAVGNILTPSFDYLPAHEKHFVTAGLVILGTVVTAMNREKAWIEG